MSHDLKKYP
jgi:hypothetical protein